MGNKSVSACERSKWSILMWKEQQPDKKWVVPFRCRSWRHKGDCCEWRGAQDFARIAKALQKHRHWLYVVLTYAQREWPDKQALYKAGVHHWSKLRKRITHSFGPIAYIQTWEKHANGGAHVNVCFSNERMYNACDGDGWKSVRRDWLEPNAVACGFGFRTWLEPLRDPDSMAGYLVKLARELTDGGHKSQIPVDAPPHFRRLRASQGLLPLPFKDPLLTGKICFVDAQSAKYAYGIEAPPNLSTELHYRLDGVQCTGEHAQAAV